MKKAIKKLINHIIIKNKEDQTSSEVVQFPNVSIMERTILSGDNRIGEYTYIGFNCMITTATIGRYCSIANNVSIGNGEHKINRVSTSSLFYKDAFATLTEKDCIIGNDVWIGSDSIIRRGTAIGNGAIIGANSFVNKDVVPFSIVAGNPAKFIKMRFSEEQIEKINKSEYWNMDIEAAKIEIKKLELTGLFETNNE